MAGFTAIGVRLRDGDGVDDFVPAREVFGGFDRPKRASPETARALARQRARGGHREGE